MIVLVGDNDAVVRKTCAARYDNDSVDNMERRMVIVLDEHIFVGTTDDAGTFADHDILVDDRALNGNSALDAVIFDRPAGSGLLSVIAHDYGFIDGTPAVHISPYADDTSLDMGRMDNGPFAYDGLIDTAVEDLGRRQ